MIKIEKNTTKEGNLTTCLLSCGISKKINNFKDILFFYYKMNIFYEYNLNVRNVRASNIRFKCVRNLTCVRK